MAEELGYTQLSVDSTRIAELLHPYLDTPLDPHQLNAVYTHLNLLVRWSAKTNLTAVRDPEAIVTRHFGESFFASARVLSQGIPATVFDLGSGAGFPGIPLALCAPHAAVTLIEAQNKKATFLKEVVRAIALQNVTVLAARGETLLGRRTKAHLVTMRAVENFAESASLAAQLVRPGGRLALLIGAAQVGVAQQLLPAVVWASPIPTPGGTARVVLIGKTVAD